MWVFGLLSKFWDFSQALYRGIRQWPDTVRTRLCKFCILHIAKHYQNDGCIRNKLIITYQKTLA